MEPDIVEPLVRASLEDIYENVATINLTDQILNLSKYNDDKMKDMIKSAMLQFTLAK